MSGLPAAAILGLMLLSVALISWSRPISWRVARRLSIVSESAYRKRGRKRGPGEVGYLMFGLGGLAASVSLLLLSRAAAGELSLVRVYGALLVGTVFVAFSIAMPPVYASMRVWFTSPEPREGDALYDLGFWVTRVGSILMGTVFVWEILRG